MSLDCEIPEFYSEDFPRARKVHRCCECGAPIAVGEEHLYARGKADGDFFVERQHLLCRELCMHMNAVSDEECCPFGAMFDAFHDGDYRNDDVHACHLMALVMDREAAAGHARG